MSELINSRFIRMGHFRLDLAKVQEYYPEGDSIIRIYLANTNLNISFTTSKERDTGLEFLDKCVHLYAEAGDK